MSKVVKVDTLGKLQQLIDGNPKVVVDFSAPAWCVPCKRFAPHFAAAADTVDAVFVEVDIDEAEVALREKFTIMSVPTVLLFKNGVASEVRARTAAQLVNEINHG